MKKTMLIAMMAGVAAGSYAASEATVETAPVATVSAQELAKAPAKSWTDSLKFKGDVRFRLESIDEEGKDTRDRARVRARLSANAEISDELSAVIGLASGESDPVSSNQSLDEGFSSKDIRLDLAYIDLHPEVLNGGKVLLGKMKQPFIAVNDLQWDGDLNPEGAAAQFVVPAGDAIKLLVNGGAFWVEERSSDDETMLYGAQAAIQMKNDDLKVTAGASYFLYDNIQGFAPVYDAEDSFGNSTVDVIDETTGEVVGILYANEYEILELFAEAGFDVGMPVVISGSFVQNQEADEDDTGYMVGIKLGKLKKPGSWDFSYSYRELEADAVLGVFADSDSYGGGTDGKTHKVSVGYQIAKNLSGHVTYFTGQKGLDDGVDYDRLQIDLVTKF